MYETAASPQALTAPNGHHLHKVGGKTVYDGPIEALPRPNAIDVDAAVRQMFSDGYAVFPNVIERCEVEMLRALMDEKGGPDDSKWEVKNWCYNRQHVTDFWQEPRLIPFVDRSAIIDVVHSIMDPGATLPVVACGRLATAAQWESTWIICPCVYQNQCTKTLMSQCRFFRPPLTST